MLRRSEHAGVASAREVRPPIAVANRNIRVPSVPLGGWGPTGSFSISLLGSDNRDAVCDCEKESGNNGGGFQSETIAGSSNLNCKDGGIFTHLQILLVVVTDRFVATVTDLLVFTGRTCA